MEFCILTGVCASHTVILIAFCIGQMWVLVVPHSCICICYQEVLSLMTSSLQDLNVSLYPAGYVIGEILTCRMFNMLNTAVRVACKIIHYTVDKWYWQPCNLYKPTAHTYSEYWGHATRRMVVFKYATLQLGIPVSFKFIYV